MGKVVSLGLWIVSIFALGLKNKYPEYSTLLDAVAAATPTGMLFTNSLLKK